MPDPDQPAPQQSLIAYELYPNTDYPIDTAPISREWMDNAHVRFPYRCLPLVIANQAGWILRSPGGFRAYWYGGPSKDDVEVRYDRPGENRVVSHFGVGTITFTIPFLFRTPPGINLWAKGPSNYIRDGIQALEGVIETDWATSTFTMNWKVTRPNEWIPFRQGEPICMIVPLPRGFTETLIPRRALMHTNPELQAKYRAWEESRKGFLKGLKTLDPETVQRGWQKDYFQGKTGEGGTFDGHQTRLAVRAFPDQVEGA